MYNNWRTDMCVEVEVTYIHTHGQCCDRGSTRSAPNRAPTGIPAHLLARRPLAPANLRLFSAVMTLVLFEA